MQRLLAQTALIALLWAATGFALASTQEDISQTEQRIEAINLEIKAANKAKELDRAAQLRTERSQLKAQLRVQKQTLRDEKKRTEQAQKRAAAERQWATYEPDRKLCSAIEYNRPDLVQQVLSEHPFDWQKKNDVCFYPLGDAVARGHLAIAEMLLKQKAPLAARAPFMPILISAVDFAAQRKEDSTELLNLLQRYGATPFDSLEDNLAGAVVNPADQASKDQLKSDYNLTSELMTMGTSLAKSVEKGHINNLAWLLANGASAEDAMNGRTALMIAVDSGDLDKVKLLVDKGADVNRRGLKFESLLAQAERKQARASGAKRERYDAIVNYLRQQGATRSDKDSN